jgi:hypothetical protein
VKGILVITLFVLFVISSCSIGSKITGMWKMTDMQLSEASIENIKTLNYNDLRKSVIEKTSLYFLRDSAYEAHYGNQIGKGRWWMEGKNLLNTQLENEDKPSKNSVVFLNKNRIELKTTDNFGNQIIYQLEKQKP